MMTGAGASRQRVMSDGWRQDGGEPVARGQADPIRDNADLPPLTSAVWGIAAVGGSRSAGKGVAMIGPIPPFNACESPHKKDPGRKICNWVGYSGFSEICGDHSRTRCVAFVSQYVRISDALLEIDPFLVYRIRDLL